MGAQAGSSHLQKGPGTSLGADTRAVTASRGAPQRRGRLSLKDLFTALELPCPGALERAFPELLQLYNQSLRASKVMGVGRASQGGGE